MSNTTFLGGLFTVTYEGKVGIGTAAPGATLPNGANSTTPKILELRGVADGTDVGIMQSQYNGNALGSDWWTDVNEGKVYLDSRWDHVTSEMHLRMRTAGTAVNAISILGSGNVGIGTTSPSVAFEVSGAGHTYSFSGDTTGSGAVKWIDTHDYTYPDTRFYIQDANNNSGRLTFDFRGYNGNNKIIAGTSTGNVGIGTTSPSAKLVVSFGSNNNIKFNMDGSYNRIVSRSDADTVNKPMRIEASTINFSTTSDISVNQGATFGGDVTAYYSDARLKDFHGVIENPLDKVMKLNGYYFTENARAKELGFDNDRMQVGVSAQEIEEVLPELIKDAPVGHGYKTIDYGKITPLLIEAIKELKTELNTLKQEMN
jgi:hypothetical protein